MNDSIFERCEKKFIISKSQKDKLFDILKDDIEEELYAKENIYSIYFDNKTDDVIRNSISRPIYKEKLRIRAYHINLNPDDNIYIELKRKYDGLGNKRRIKIKYKDFNEFIKLHNKVDSLEDDYLNNEIYSEIINHLKLYKSSPKILIKVYREAYHLKSNKEFRITFDSNISYRYDNLDFVEGKNKNLIDDNTYIMEVKFKNSIPYYISKIFNDLEIYRTRYSKYGKIYTKELKENK